MIDTIIFDLDGVICSTDHYHYLAWKKLSDELHISFDEKDNEKLRGVSRMESLDIILEKSRYLKMLWRFIWRIVPITSSLSVVYIM